MRWQKVKSLSAPKVRCSRCVVRNFEYKSRCFTCYEHSEKGRKEIPGRIRSRIYWDGGGVTSSAASYSRGFWNGEPAKAPFYEFRMPKRSLTIWPFSSGFSIAAKEN
jgi:hypothetical protein